MFKKYLLILIAAFAMISTSGCSLFSSDSEETKEEAVSEDTATDEEVSDSTEEVAGTSDEEEVVDEYPDDDYGGDESAVATTTVDSGDTVASGDSSALPDQPVEGTTDDTLLVGADESSTSTEAPPMDPAPVQDTTSSSTISDSYVPETTYVSVKKMKKTPYNVGGALINRLYIAREGDSISTVAEKALGDSSRSNDLLKWNPHFRGKDLKVGDKVYYASVKSPNDNSQILLYYEEAGIQPSYYTGHSGDSLRKVSKKLLGHERSWMEIYATNDSVEDKWQLPEGAQVRYWPSGTTAAPIQAEAAPAPTPSEEEMPAPPDASGEGQNIAQNDGGAATAPDAGAPAPTEAMPEETPADDSGAGAAATVAANEEPPAPPPEATAPPPAAQIEPPPPPADEASSGGIAGLMGGGEDDSMMMAVLGGLLIVAALIMIVFIRRGRKKVNYG